MIKTSTVSRVIDGDTFETTAGEVIRLADVDAPESNEWGGAAATDELRRLIGGKVVTIDSVATDDYGRTVAEVTVGGVSVNAAMRKFLN